MGVEKCFGFCLLRDCSHKGVENGSKMNKGKENNIQFIIASENTVKPFDAAKKPFNLITPFVQLLIIVPRIFSIAF